MTLNDSRIQCFCFDEQLINPGVPHPQRWRWRLSGGWLVLLNVRWGSGFAHLLLYCLLALESHLKSCLEKLTHQKFLLPTENWDTLENSQDPLLGRDTSSSQMKSQFLYMTPLFCFFLIVQWICRSKTWELSSLCLEALWPYRSHHLVLPFLWVWLGIAGGVRGAVQKVERTGQTLGVELPQLLKNLFLLVEYFTNLQIC